MRYLKLRERMNAMTLFALTLLFEWLIWMLPLYSISCGIWSMKVMELKIWGQTFSREPEKGAQKHEHMLKGFCKIWERYTNSSPTRLLSSLISCPSRWRDLGDMQTLVMEELAQKAVCLERVFTRVLSLRWVSGPYIVSVAPLLFL